MQYTKYMLSKRSGFTLIEILVTISIVGIISAISYVSYSSAQSSGRDSKRKQDLKSIQTALELYRQQNKSYPLSFTGAAPATNSCCDDANVIDSKEAGWFTALSNFINAIPKDPQTDDGNMFTAPLGSDKIKTGFSYWSAPVSGGSCPTDTAGGQYYILATGLENEYDPQANSQKNYKPCWSTTTNISVNNNTYIITSQ